MSGGGELETVTRVVNGQAQTFQRRAYGTGPTHGVASTYRSQDYACRCQPCRDANAALHRRENARRREMLAADPTVVQHGLRSTYVNWGCRCEACSEVHAAHLKRCREARAARLKADPSIREHGTVATYTGWGCRCDECRAASVAHEARRRGAS